MASGVSGTGLPSRERNGERVRRGYPSLRPGRIPRRPEVLLRYHVRPDSLSSEVRPPRVWAVLEIFDELHDLIGVRRARAALAWTACKAATYRRVRGCPWRAVGFLLAALGRIPRRTDVWRALLGCLAESAIPPLRPRQASTSTDAQRRAGNG